MRDLLTTAIVVVALIVGGCSEAVQATTEQVNYIDFLISTDPLRSRSEVVESYLDLDSVGVFGFVEGCEDPFFDDMTLSRVRRSWSYSSPALWSDYNDLSSLFYCYSPCAAAHNCLEVEASARQLTLSYSVPERAEDHPYIMVSYPELCAPQWSSTVEFVMQHPLCVVSFSGEGLSILSLEIEGVGVQATLTLFGESGEFVWSVPSRMGSVWSSEGDCLMMIPQGVAAEGVVRVVSDLGVLQYSLAGEVWAPNKRVDYTLAADSCIALLNVEN